MDDHDNRVGLDSLDSDELSTLCRRIVHVTNAELDTSVKSIHVTGSFARGDASLGESDLDIRIVTEGYVSATNLSSLTTRIESEETPQHTPTGCDNLDIHATPFELLQTEPSVEIWSR
jgi:predicted nucleotidyltransferase